MMNPIHLDSMRNQESVDSAPYVRVKGGKKYTFKFVQHHSLWQFLEGFQAFMLTILTLGTGPFWWRVVRDKWEHAITGQEKVRIYTRFPENIVTQKTSQTVSYFLSQEDFNKKKS